MNDDCRSMLLNHMDCNGESLSCIVDMVTLPEDETDNEISIIALKGAGTIKCFENHKYSVHATLPDDLNTKKG